MLVLLIIFLITIRCHRSIPVQLPKERNLPTQTRRRTSSRVDKDAGCFWNNHRRRPKLLNSSRRSR